MRKPCISAALAVVLAVTSATAGIVGALLLTTAAAANAGQRESPWPTLKGGTELTITTVSGPSFSGRLRAVDDREMLLNAGDGTTLTIVKNDVCRIKARSPDKRAMWVGGLAAAGGLLGLVAGRALVNDTNGPLLVLPLVGVASGAAAGAAIGRPREKVVFSLPACPANP